MIYQVELTVVFSAPLDVDQLDELTDQVLDKLYELENVIDPDLGGSMTSRVFTFSFGVEEATLAAAQDHAHSALRTAVHATGGFTPGWTGDGWSERSMTTAPREPIPA